MCSAGPRDLVDSSHDRDTPGSRSAQRIARTIVAERVRGVVARNRTQRRRLLSTTSSDDDDDVRASVVSVDCSCRAWRYVLVGVRSGCTINT